MVTMLYGGLTVHPHPGTGRPTETSEKVPTTAGWRII